MNAMNVTQARANLFQLIVNVNLTSEPITLTNSKGKNAVLIGEEDWNAIQETLYLNSVPGMYDSLKKGMETPLENCMSENDFEW
ncbi:type II toxin-antitoxin system Phd/YefM family antitoxin [Treponema pedis]|uniref:type II toxin-antitoxin system Phd/YefM family antitoxin n=1 Tax=Treponema pedis TaxID=409322 RepID=UPI0004250E19|nr:type II toxin-antitoxin system Phd/YefM family antitoxin [Treponema pedis]